jgi:AAA family ATP:ADP antiporter
VEAADERPRSNRLLRPVGLVYRDETVTLALLTLSGFLLLTSYYMLKVVREVLIVGGAGAEVKAYSGAGQAVLLIAALRVYGLLFDRLDPRRLVGFVYVFFLLTLALFAVLGRCGLPLAVPFYLWVGVFNVIAISQYWSLITDLYTQEQGTRLFGIVGIGGGLGAIVGAAVSSGLLRLVGTYALMLLAGGVLLLSLGVAWTAHRRETRRTRPPPVPPPARSGNTARLLTSDHYLILVAALTLLLNTVSSLGEYVLDRTLLQAAHVAHGAAVSQFVGAFRARFFAVVNVLGLVLQLLLVSRIMRRGVGTALLILPLAASAGYMGIALVPTLSVMAAYKTVENSLNYSVENTARHGLFLVTSRVAKFKAKIAIDGLLPRMGDVVSAALVLLGSLLHLSTRRFVAINVGLAPLLLAVTFAVARLYRDRSASRAAEAPA